MKIFERKHLVLEYDPELKCVIQHWKGFASSEEFREGCRETAEQFKKRKANKLISNTKNFALVKREDSEWAAREITPLLVKSGMKYMAFIVPENVFSQLSVDNFKKSAENILQPRYFEELKDARNWFMQLEDADFAEMVSTMNRV